MTHSPTSHNHIRLAPHNHTPLTLPNETPPWYHNDYLGPTRYNSTLQKHQTHPLQALQALLHPQMITWIAQTMQHTMLFYHPRMIKRPPCRVYNAWLDILRPRKMTAIFQTIFSHAFCWMKMFEFRKEFHWSLFLGVQLTIKQRWLR